MQSRDRRVIEEFTTSTANSTVNYGWDNCPRIQVANYSSMQLIKPTLLDRYRLTKANANYQMSCSESKGFIPQIICTFLGVGSVVTSQQKIKCKCPCEKTKDGYCELIMKWIEQQYFWKTDRQFNKIYEYYLNKKLQENIECKMKQKLKQKVEILGLIISQSQQQILIEVISNYLQHTLYYNKYDKLVAHSDIYIWVALGLQTSSFDVSFRKILMFWALDITMDHFGDLSPHAAMKHHHQCLEIFQHYYSKWIQLLNSKQVSIKNIIWEWQNQMMFGYMGIESIAFFISCYRKIQWKYLYQVMLSYFEHRTNSIKKNTNFLDGTIDKENLYKLILDGKQEWPMIFCTASTYIFKQ